MPFSADDARTIASHSRTDGSSRSSRWVCPPPVSPVRTRRKRLRLVDVPVRRDVELARRHLATEVGDLGADRAHDLVGDLAQDLRGRLLAAVAAEVERLADRRPRRPAPPQALEV